MFLAYFILAVLICSVVAMFFDEKSFWQAIKDTFSWSGLKRKAFKFIYALDILIGTLLGGEPKETMSSRLYTKTTFEKHSKVWVYSRNIVDFVALYVFNDVDHCYNSFMNDRRGLHQSKYLNMTDDELEQLKRY